MLVDSHYARRANEVLRHEGIGALRKRALAFVQRLLRVRHWYRRELFASIVWDESTPELDSDLTLEIRELGHEDIPAYVAFRADAGDPVDGGEAAVRLDLGHICTGAWHDGRLVAASWIVPGRACIDELQRCVDIPLDRVYYYDSFTHPDVRGHNVAGARGTVTRRMLRAEGYTGGYCVVNPSNVASRRQMKKAGWTIDGSVGYLQAFGQRLDFAFLHGRRPTLSRRPAPPLDVLVSRQAEAASRRPARFRPRPALKQSVPSA